MKTVKYTRTYYEDIGRDEKTGVVHYAYCYFLYYFYLSDTEVIKFRQYTDTAQSCSMFFSLNQLKDKSDKASKKKLNVIYAILRFMQKEFNITELYYFNHTYIPIDTDNIGETPDIVFEQVLSS